jgi:hypothetical protein
VVITSGAPKPCAPPSMSPNVSPASASTPRTWPAQSNGADRVGECTTVAIIATMTAQTGTLTPNTHRQSTVVNTPPSRGPSAAATAPPTAHTPSARARRPGSGKASRINAMDAGSITVGDCTCSAALR